MNNVWRLFKGDLKRLTSNTVTVITVIGLILIPSIFSWYNILACWDAFDNTGNLKVAVANTDAGFKSDLVPTEINIGEQVVSALRANDQLDWVITDVDDAIDGTKSGTYYAAVVIPESFSEDMMSFYSSDIEHADIIYYTNEKKNAIAPKVTGQGADRVAAQVNQVFSETLSEVVLGASSTLLDYAESSDVDGRIGQLASHMESFASTLSQSASVLRTYSSVLDSSATLLGKSGDLLAKTQASAAQVYGDVRSMADSSQNASAAMREAVGRLSAVVSDQVAGVDNVEGVIEGAFGRVADVSTSSSALVGEAAVLARSVGDVKTAEALEEAAAKIEAARVEAASTREDVLAKAESARQKLGGAKSDLEEDLRPSLEQLATSVSNAGDSINETAALLDSIGTDMVDSTGALGGKLLDSKAKLDAAAAKLDQSAAELNELGGGLREALSNGDIEKLRDVIGADPARLAVSLSSPVKLDRRAVYPVENFGSAMTPLYTTLALWIGSLLIMVTLRVVPSRRIVNELNNPSMREVFIGRYGVIGLISLMQSTCVSLGNMLFLGVQVVHPLLYLMCFWISGLAFSFMIYTLVALFANLGKAIGVLLLILQVSGGGGSFPLQLLPQFFQDVSPYLPITHAVNAMRAAMFGVYNGDFWIQIGTLVLFTVPFFILGLVLNKPLSYIVPKFVEKVESTKVM